MKNLRRKMERFFYRNRNKGIPNLMLWFLGANVVSYLFYMMDSTGLLYSMLCFDRDLIFQGQVWRLFSFLLLEFTGTSPFLAIFFLIFYYQMGQTLENVWGTCKFNIYFLTAWLMSVISGLLLNYASFSFIHTSMFLAFATMYPDTQFRIFFIIPLKARWLGIFDLAMYLYLLLRISIFPINLMPLFALANYFLYFGKDIANIFPDSWRINARRLFRRKKQPSGSKTIPFRPTGSYEGDNVRPKAPYTHKCVICGRTDLSDPGLEFRYCSRCKGYHCYCIDHINNHSHVE